MFIFCKIKKQKEMRKLILLIMFISGSMVFYAQTGMGASKIDTLASIGDVNRNLKVYPHPSEGIFKIENVFNDYVIISLYDEKGQNVMNINEFAGFEDHIEVDALHLPNGKYFGIVRTKELNYFFNIVIKRWKR